MHATLSQLHCETRRIVRPVIHGGEEVVITDFGKPVARIVPYMPTVTVSPSQARESGTLDDDSIMAAIIEAREDELERPPPFGKVKMPATPETKPARPLKLLSLDPIQNSLSQI
jgi:antitoxin (DNA-binding transcriptional repressor) of toxin-antitoxin stability system